MNTAAQSEATCLKVGFFAPTLDSRSGGVFTVVDALARALGARRNTEAKCFAPTSLSVWRSLLGGDAARLVEGFRKEHLELVHLHGLWLAHSEAAANLSLSGVPEVISPHGMLDPWAFGHQGWKKRIVWMTRERAHLRRASAIHALCAPEAEAVRRLGIRSPIAVIPNGVDLPSEGPISSPPWAGTFPHDAKVLMFFGRLHPKKGALQLIEAWGKLKGHTGEWRLALLGWDEIGYGRECEQAMERLGILDTCRWFGPAFGDAKAAAYANANAFILPSFSEGMPVAVLEAWANRLPAFMTSACNLAEGFAANAAQEVTTNPNELAEQLKAGLLANGAGARLAAMGMAGRALVEQRFTWDQVAAEFAQLYRWLCRGGARPSCVME